LTRTSECSIFGVVTGMAGYEVFDVTGGYCSGPFETKEDALEWRRSQCPAAHRCHLVIIEDRPDLRQVNHQLAEILV